MHESGTSIANTAARGVQRPGRSQLPRPGLSLPGLRDGRMPDESCLIVASSNHARSGGSPCQNSTLPIRGPLEIYDQMGGDAKGGSAGGTARHDGTVVFPRPYADDLRLA